MDERFCDIIDKKKNGLTLTEDEIHFMIEHYVSGDIPDYQMSAMLMAICFQGMTDEELSTMTLAMMNTGECIDLSGIKGVKVDKHSTGGVGDKTTMLICPLVAAAGVPVAKMSGRGLGFTGGTIDKLESIPGFKTAIGREDFCAQVNEIGICIAGQSGELAPADKKMYALRDVTATVQSIPLITASVMCKKLAAGGDKILLDVTMGSGAFMQNFEDSLEISKKMVAIGTSNGHETVALITNMDQPLGYAIGNNLEVKEVIEALHGNGPEDLMEVCYALASNMIYMANQDSMTLDEAAVKAKELVNSGAAWVKFLEVVAAQGGDTSYLENPDKFPQATIQFSVEADTEGYLYHMDTAQIGMAASMLGAGRTTIDSKIDNSAGIILKKKPGDKVAAGDVLAVLYGSEEEQVKMAKKHFLSACEFRETKPEPMKAILGRVTKDTFISL